MFKAANHPLSLFIPRVKACCYNLRRSSNARPSTKSERFKNTFVNRLNRLIFRYNLALESKVIEIFNLLSSKFICI